MFDYAHHTVLVTGASGSIGQAITRGFAAAGARVALHYAHNRAPAEALLAELPGDDHLLVQADLDDPASVLRMFDKVLGAWQRLDVLVNNAAIEIACPVTELDYAQWQYAWQQVIGVNLLGAANASYLAARQMLQQGGGRIVNVGSRGAYRGEPQHTNYGASKAALHALGQSLAQELGPHNIGVISVAPGFVEGGMAAEVLAGPQGDAIRAQSPLGRVATPDEIAYTVLFAASPGAAWLTGAVIDVNGASYLR